MKKPAIDLVYSVAEIISLFEQTRSIESFLKQTVTLIAEHMVTDLCSIYLIDQESGNLVLRASTGLKPEAVGKLSLAPGEGITGKALKELRPIIAPKAAEYPGFKPIPNIDEEPYESFLAVPILHGLRRIGVIVCQHGKAAYFNQRDSRALTAIAAQLAAMIENAMLLMELHQEQKIQGPGDSSLPGVLKGHNATKGIGLGASYALTRSSTGAYLKVERDVPYATGRESFLNALEETKQQIQELQQELKKNFLDVGSLIFHAHLLMLTDSAFSGEMLTLIESGKEAAEAVVEVVNRYISIFSQTDSIAVREKAQDLKDLGHRLLQNLRVEKDTRGDYQDSIILTEELFPSELIKLAAQGAAGIIVHKACITSHLQILAQSIKIPMISVDDKRLFSVEDGTRLILDGYQGNVFINPEQETLDEFIRISQEHARLPQIQPVRTSYTLTDGSELRILANISLLGDLRLAKAYGAQGIGLYRSEFPFIIRNDFPSEEEQYLIYRRLFEEFDGSPIYMRILDIGGDKQLEFIDETEEPNPFLGLRAIRFSLKNRDILDTQLRAMLRAGVGGDLRIMIPFLTSLDELRTIKAALKEQLEELAQDEIPHNPQPSLGIMVELPATGYILEELAGECDFMSIGTNDLVQYLLGVDRTNPRVADHYDPYHPAVLRFIANVADTCARHNLPLSICGDVAAEETMFRFAVGVGIRDFSVAPPAASSLEKWMEYCYDHEAQKAFAAEILKLSTGEEIRTKGRRP